MNWWERQISLGWKGPVGQPRGSSLAPFPLASGVRYRVSHSPGKSHLLTPGQDYAYCGLTLALEETWLIDSGYDEFYWIVEDDRDAKNWCKPCSTWQQRWHGSAQSDSLKVDSPVTVLEWEATVGKETKIAKARLDMMAATVARWIEGEVVDE